MSSPAPVLAPDRRNPTRDLLCRLAAAALEAADPAPAVARLLTHREFPVGAAGYHLIAIGKAAPAMARGAHDVLGPPRGGIVVTHVAAPVPPDCVLVVADHPVPGEASLQAGEQVLQFATATPPGTPVLCLISGGGSALCEATRAGVTLELLRDVTTALLRSGATIQDMNVVRQQLSRFKGGGLGAALAPTTCRGLVLSDVVGSPLESIASGPLTAPSTRPADAMAILTRHAPDLAARVGSIVDQAPSPDRATVEDVEIVADGAAAAHAVAAAARTEGLEARVVDTALTGEARKVARSVLARAMPGLDVYAGETTVTVAGSGLGGRNQEAALSAALALRGATDRWFLALGTDGADGPTDAAGAIVDGDSLDLMVAAEVDPEAALANNDSHAALEVSGDLLRPGATGTNVGDIWLVLRRP